MVVDEVSGDRLKVRGSQAVADGAGHALALLKQLNSVLNGDNGTELLHLPDLRHPAVEAVLASATRRRLDLPAKGAAWQSAQELATKCGHFHQTIPFRAGERTSELWHVEPSFYRPRRSGHVKVRKVTSDFRAIIE